MNTFCRKFGSAKTFVPLISSLFMCALLLAQDNYVFGPSIRVNDDPPGSCYHGIVSSGQHGIACRGDTVYVVFADQRAGPTSIYFAKSIDAGQTWGANVRVAGGLSTFATAWASIALDDQGYIYVVCQVRVGAADDDIYFIKSTDGGTSFLDSVLVNDTTRTVQNRPSVAVDSGGQNIYVAWQDVRNPINFPNLDIYFARSTDGGMTFSSSIRVDDAGSDSSWQQYPSTGCTRSGDTVYVTWTDRRNGTRDIYFSRSVDSGQTFEANYIVNDTAGVPSSVQWQSSLCVSRSGYVYAAWDDNRAGGYHVWIDKSIDGGVSFNQDVMVSDMPASSHPSVAVDDSECVYVAWDDSRDFSTSGYDIYFAFSSDGGNTFRNDVRVNDLAVHPGAWDWNANVTANNAGRVFVAWDTDRHDPFGNKDIYSATGIYQAIEEDSDCEVSRIVIQVFPNPFRDKLRIIMNNPQSNGDLILRIYDISGRCIKTLFKRYSDQLIWAGIDDKDNVLPAGVYFLCLEVNESLYTKKVIKVE